MNITDLYNKGFKLFPVRKNGKAPAFKGWQEWAKNSTIEDIKNYQEKNPESNWGIATEFSNLTVIDLDDKGSKKGSQVFKKILKENKEIPVTFTVKTPSNGWHLYFSDCTCQGGVNVYGDGIDVRSKGQYVLAPGSKIDGIEYIITKDIEFAKFPERILSKYRQKTKEIINDSDGIVFEGERNQTLARFAGLLRSRGATFETILDSIRSLNENQVSPALSDYEVQRIAESVSRYKPSEAEAVSSFLNTKTDETAELCSEIDFNTLPRRQWLWYGKYIRGFISVLIAPGGVGKSLLTILDAITLSAGRAISGPFKGKQSRVWLYNTEDPLDELKRRIHAYKQFYNLTSADLENLYISSGQDKSLHLVIEHKNATVVNDIRRKEIISFIRAKKIDLLIIDPFLRAHKVNENDNIKIDTVIEVLQSIAQSTNCAILLVHHTAKGKHMQGNADAARGATAVINAARISHTFTSMGEKEAEEYQVDEDQRFKYVRFDAAKLNLCLGSGKPVWFEKQTVNLANGDAVGVLGYVDLEKVLNYQNSMAEGVKGRELCEVLATLMPSGVDRISVREVCKFLIEEKGELFGLNSERRVGEKIIGMLKDGLSFNGLTFVYVCYGAKKIRNWVKKEVMDKSVSVSFLLS